MFYFVFEGNFPSTSPRGAYIWRGDLTEGFLCHRFGGLIFGILQQENKRKERINGFDRNVRWSRELGKPLLHYESLYYEWKYLIMLGAR